MGLREKASDFTKKTDDIAGLPDLFLKPSEIPRGAGPKTEPGKQTENKSQNTSNPLASGQGREGRKKPDKLETVLSLLELFKEFGEADTENDLWQILVYSLLGQLGSRDIAIFLIEDGRLTLKAFHGFTLQKDFLYPAKPAIPEILNDGQSRPASEILAALNEAEKQLFVSLNIQTVTPVRRYEEFRGLILTGKPAAGQVLIKDDYYYLRLCGELLGSFEKQLRRLANAGERENNARQSIEALAGLSRFSDAVRLTDNTDDVFNHVRQILTETFSLNHSVLFVKEQFSFIPVFSTGISAEAIKGTELSAADNWLEQNSSSGDWFISREFQNKDELSALLPESEKKYLKICAGLPLRAGGELRGFFLTFYKEGAVDSQNLNTAGIYITSAFYKILNNRILKPGASDSGTNPVQALRHVLAEKEDTLARTGTPFAILVMDMANLSRLKNLYGDHFLKTAREKTREILLKHSTETDFLTEIFHGHFIGVFPGQENGDIFRISRIVQREIGKEFPDEDTRPLFSVKIYARPYNDRIPWEMLFKAN